MTNLESTSAATATAGGGVVAPKAGVRRALWWIAWCLPAAAVAVLMHELGHFALMRLFGFPDAVLHFASASSGVEGPLMAALRDGDVAGAAAIVPLHRAALVSGAGILVSYATMVACIFLVRRRGPHPFLIALGLVSTLRFNLGVSILYDRIVKGDRYISGTDEGMFAATLGIPEELAWAIGLSLVAVTWVMLIRAIPRGSRWRDGALTVVGVAAGLAAYALVVGPIVLP